MNINYFGSVFSSSGYSQLRHLFLRLSRKNHCVKIKQMGTRDSVNILYEDELKKLEKTELKTPYINVTSSIGPALVPDPSASYNIAYSMFETLEIPETWVHFYNQFDEIWVPSQFCKKAFNRKDVKPIIHVIPFGIDESYFSYDKVNHELFTFFASGQWVDRKGWDILIRAYTAEFMGNFNVRLCIKTFNDVKTKEEMIKEYLDPNKRNLMYPRIMIANRKIDECEMPIFYQESDCFISCSRGEAFCIPCLEAMSMGIPVITPDFGGQLDFVNNEVGYLIKIEQLKKLSERICSINKGYDGLWFGEPNIDDVRKIMRYVFEHQQEAKEKGMKSRVIAKEFLWDKITDKAENRLSEIFKLLEK
jgi:glycosyltransferase involved in cell wall biosynthesis